MLQKTSPKVGCFVGFYHHCLVTMSMHLHAYCDPLCESGMETGL